MSMSTNLNSNANQGGEHGGEYGGNQLGQGGNETTVLLENTVRDRRAREPFQALQLSSRTVTRCHLCGFAEVRTDEVIDGEVLYLAECPRCENRWTSRAPIGRALPLVAAARPVGSRFQRVAARVTARVAPAA